MDEGNVPDERRTVEWVSTGSLPSDTEVEEVVSAGYERFRHLDEGRVSSYIPALAQASPEAFGVCVTGVQGRVFAIGDADQEFTLQSISKLFVFALVCDTIGPEEARRKLGVNSTGLPFDSVMGIELNEDRTMNPMVNAGALATTSLVPGASPEEKFERIAAALSVFAGRPLVVDDVVYRSEAATNDRNRGIAHLLAGYGRMYCDPDVATDIYTRQCSLPRQRPRPGRHGGDAGRWRGEPADGHAGDRVGMLPARAGRLGHRRALRAVGRLALRRRPAGQERSQWGTGDRVPRQGRSGTFSPPLDEAGNSVRGQRMTTYLSERLGLNLFASAPRLEDRTDREGSTVGVHK